MAAVRPLVLLAIARLASGGRIHNADAKKSSVELLSRHTTKQQSEPPERWCKADQRHFIPARSSRWRPRKPRQTTSTRATPTGATTSGPASALVLSNATVTNISTGATASLLVHVNLPCSSLPNLSNACRSRVSSVFQCSPDAEACHVINAFLGASIATKRRTNHRDVGGERAASRKPRGRSARTNTPPSGHRRPRNRPRRHRRSCGGAFWCGRADQTPHRNARLTTR